MTLIITSTLVLAVLLFIYKLVLMAEQSAKSKDLERIIKDINHAKNIRKRFNSDSNFANRVRKLFTRK